jgi:maltokinase
MTLIAKPDLSPLLEDFLQRQRWFAGRDRRVNVVLVKSLSILNDGLPALLHVEAEVIYTDGAAERYQLLVGIDDHSPKANPSLVLGRLNVQGRELVAYDALVDARLCQVLLDLMAAGADLNGLRFRYSTPPGRGYRAASSRLLDAEQSNTSVVYDERFILKVVRRLEAGVNPDLEVTRLLARQGFSGVAAPVGWIESAESTLAVLKPFFAGSMEGWELALHRTRAWHSGDTAADFGEEAVALGTVTAEMHLALAEAFPTSRAGARELQALRRRRQDELTRTITLVPSLRSLAGGIRTVFEAAEKDFDDAHLQRIHGDLHLGQVLRLPGGSWVILDFEGEPARPMAERQAPDNPLRDVGGMLRSFDYAAFHPLVTDSNGDEAGATTWTARARTAFLDGYWRAMSGAGYLPPDPATLLRGFELEKALYEVRLEAAYRPDWLPIPIGGVKRLVDDKLSEPAQD